MAWIRGASRPITVKIRSPLKIWTSRQSFYAGTADDRRFRYLNAKHEVSEWMETHKRQGLRELLDKLNDGEDFNTAYGS